MNKVWKCIVCSLLLCMLLCTVATAEAVDITAQCKYWVSEGKTEDLTDANMVSAWKPKGENAEVRFGFPEGTGYIAVDWADEPTGYVFTQLDENLMPIATETEQDSFGTASQMFRLDPAARNVSIVLTQPGQAIHKVRIYSAGELPANVKDWSAPHEKCDLMVISTHQDDEWIFFGGIIPYYEQVRKKDVQVVYMADCGRLRKAEAMNGLWVSGSRHYPQFVDLVDERINSIEKTLEHWGGSEGVTGILVEQIRRYKPEVILTHDLNGEYGHNQHRVTSRSMQTAIEAAANPEMFPESYEKYGAWQVKKLYLHLASSSPIDFDWNVSYDELNGRTPLQVAQIAYAEHVSQQKYYQVNDGGKYDNSLFGLTYSVVGDDVLHTDLFENVDELTVAMPEPVATMEPVAAQPEQTEAPTEQTEAPQPTLAPVVGETARTGGKWWIFAIVTAVILLVVAAVLLEMRRREMERRRRLKNARRRRSGYYQGRM